MNKPLPTGTISLDDAVERTARHERPELNVVYRVEGGEAWRKLCGFAEKGRGGARMVTKSGFVMTVYRAQFVGFKDRYWKFASVLRYPPNDKGVPEEIERFPSYDLLDESLNPHRNASLVFLESELEVALAGRATRAGERASRPPAPDHFNSRPRKLKISGYIRDDRLRAFFSSRTDIGDALTPLSVAIPAIAKTKNMRRYREDSWLGDLDSN